MSGMGIVSVIGTALGLAGKIMDIVAEKGDDADDMRLADIPGWKTLKKKCRKKDSVKAFRKAWRERKKKP